MKGRVYVTVGSQKIPFDRLLQYVDNLAREKKMDKNQVFMQTGVSSFIPENAYYSNFVDQGEHEKLVREASVIITHAGTGSIIRALNNKKKIIIVPRESKLNEHVDNHQFQIMRQFTKMKYCMSATNYDELKKAYEQLDIYKFNEFKSNNEFFINEMKRYL
ncbi:PssE/Cps14G family polysaccharide biosynthesis glycosyltransferase [Vagococcus lutrae]|uniref:PssE/Cps14G family polysaccharide biosynthesis glycosyltransferase n=1 Tax=Vagococcus lutrae TaxID=81947 RepID=UPI000F85BBC3|nr:PssE/Cps14G family polysaccharide biosynthesis glycosyltransferase [Vagococcus lutrae]RST93839.1 hypothetical protein CBF33_01065 [Vagococcus lutrae]